ncbi:hypothetical protein TD95_002314 [Thielaviopsis punctulata]|uniref:Protein kinase domain-containing protein n=1 Tax=Thielaviopsis punctulata TaxID=72032 RepID=A0A0F4ZC43_9PEZI|nr:hypothetical protein TD95_002314 [Thielaviopsis punctulata]
MAGYLAGGDSMSLRTPDCSSNRLTMLYNDTKESIDFVKTPIQSDEDPDIKDLCRKVKILKNRLASWSTEWTTPHQPLDLDAILPKVGLSDVFGSVMLTIQDILRELEAMWDSAQQQRLIDESPLAMAAAGDSKKPMAKWDKGHFANLVHDLTVSIDTLYDISRAWRSDHNGLAPAKELLAMESRQDSAKNTEPSRTRTPQKIDPKSLTPLESLRSESTAMMGAEFAMLKEGIVFMANMTTGSSSHDSKSETASKLPWKPLLLQYAPIHRVYSKSGLVPSLDRMALLFEKLQQPSPHLSFGDWTGLPTLIGYFEDIPMSRVGLVYQLPDGFDPLGFERDTQNPVNTVCTLDELLSRPDFQPPLEVKFRLAYHITRVVFDLHSRGITHGAVFDTNILFSRKDSECQPNNSVSDVDSHRPLISSFEIFSPWNEAGLDDPTPNEVNQIYRHPLDPHVTPHSPLVQSPDLRVMDLYSLAVMLLSIGMWTKPEYLVIEGAPSVPESLIGQLALGCGTLYMKAVQKLWSAVDMELGGRNNGQQLLDEIQRDVSRYLKACSALDCEEPSIRPPAVQKPKLSKKPTSRMRFYKGSEAAMKKQIEAFGRHGLYEDEEGDPEPKPSPPSRPSGYPLLSQSDEHSVVVTPGSTPAVAPTPVVESPLTVGPAPVVGSTPTELAPMPKEKPKLRLYNQVQVPLPSEVVDTWNQVLMHQINQALKQFYRKHPETVEISLESMGTSPAKTKPTVLIVCSSVAKVKAILKRKLGDLFDDETGMGFGLKVCSGKLVRSQHGNAESSRAGSGSGANASADAHQDARNSGYQAQPSNGASIGAWTGDRHLPPVSFGGLVMVDNKPYGMTVHHMLDEPDVHETHAGAEDVRQSISQPKKMMPATADAVVHRSSGRVTQPTVASDEAPERSYAAPSQEYMMELSDSEDELADDSDIDKYLSDSDSDDFASPEPGDIPGIEAGFGESYVVTQPARDDVMDDFFPAVESADEEHLYSHRLGEVFASSGIRRRVKNGLIHEIDWALFEFEENRMPKLNTIPRIDFGGGSAVLPSPKLAQNARRPTVHRKDVPPLHPTTVAAMFSLPGMEVQCMARTSGLQTGKILSTLSTVKFPGRTTPSHSYQVAPLPGALSSASLPIGPPGDSGAWVVDRRQGLVCGHVLAWSQRRQVAYICPMDVLLLDIADTLGASEVGLPGGEALVRLLHDQISDEQHAQQVREMEEREGQERERRRRDADGYEASLRLAEQLEGLEVSEKTRGFLRSF